MRYFSLRRLPPVCRRHFAAPRAICRRLALFFATPIHATADMNRIRHTSPRFAARYAMPPLRHCYATLAPALHAFYAAATLMPCFAASRYVYFLPLLPGTPRCCRCRRRAAACRYHFDAAAFAFRHAILLRVAASHCYGFSLPRRHATPRCLMPPTPCLFRHFFHAITPCFSLSLFDDCVAPCFSLLLRIFAEAMLPLLMPRRCRASMICCRRHCTYTWTQHVTARR